MFAIIIGMKKGLTRPGPFSSMMRCCASRVWIPPMPVPMMTPARSGSGMPPSNPESTMAWCAAARAYWVKRSVRRASLASMYCVTSKFLTSPAMRESSLEGSNRVMVVMPLRPPTNPSHNSGTELPRGVIAPSR